MLRKKIIFAERGRTFHSCTSQNITSLLIYCIWNCILSEQVLPLKNMHVYNIKKHACVQYECNATLALFVLWILWIQTFYLLLTYYIVGCMHIQNMVGEANSWLKAKKKITTGFYWQKKYPKILCWVRILQKINTGQFDSLYAFLG